MRVRICNVEVNEVNKQYKGSNLSGDSVTGNVQ
jgi:hypothetical protein